MLPMWKTLFRRSTGMSMMPNDPRQEQDQSFRVQAIGDTPAFHVTDPVREQDRGHLPDVMRYRRLLENDRPAIDLSIKSAGVTRADGSNMPSRGNWHRRDVRL